jgi:hypothetical protein
LDCVAIIHSPHSSLYRHLFTLLEADRQTFSFGLAQVSLRWKESELKKRRKGDKGKVALAQRLRQPTTMSLQTIAQRLEMGSWTYVSNLLRQKTNPKSANSED